MCNVQRFCCHWRCCSLLATWHSSYRLPGQATHVHLAAKDVMELSCGLGQIQARKPKLKSLQCLVPRPLVTQLVLSCRILAMCYGCLMRITINQAVQTMEYAGLKQAIILLLATMRMVVQVMASGITGLIGVLAIRTRTSIVSALSHQETLATTSGCILLLMEAINGRYRFHPRRTIGQGCLRRIACLLTTLR